MPVKNTPWFSDLIKDKFVKYSLYIILTLIVIFLTFFVGKALVGYNVRFFGNETRPVAPKTDTLYKTVPPETIYVQKPNTFGRTLRSLNEQDKINLISKVEKTRIEKNLPSTVKITLQCLFGDDDSTPFALEIAEFLASKGYSINPDAVPTPMPRFSFEIFAYNGTIFINTGIWGKP